MKFIWNFSFSQFQIKKFIKISSTISWVLFLKVQIDFWWKVFHFSGQHNETSYQEHSPTAGGKVSHSTVLPMSSKGWSVCLCVWVCGCFWLCVYVWVCFVHMCMCVFVCMFECVCFSECVMCLYILCVCVYLQKI